MLAAELQRANITRRLERIEANPTQRVLGLVGGAVKNPLVTRVGIALAALAVRTYQKKRSEQGVKRSRLGRDWFGRTGIKRTRIKLPGIRFNLFSRFT